MAQRGLLVGGRLDAGGARDGERIELDANGLTTHGVILGMTGSGKTGLGVSLIEEVLAAGVPVLALDPKGDLTNLLLTFPQLRPEDFAPWMPSGSDPAAVAATWSEGLAGWGIDGTSIAALRDAVRMGVYTPGSNAATPLNLVGDLAAPAGSSSAAPNDQPDGGAVADSDLDDEAVVDEVEAMTAGLLGLVGIEGDPLASPEHLLVSNLIHTAWTRGEPLDLPMLLTRIQTPPMRSVGVMDLDSVIPPDRRTALAVRLNGVLASPGFATWATGAPLDIERLLFAADGRPSLACVTLSHLSDAERQLAVSRILAALIRWFRAQPGTDQLRVLVYIDEVAGYAPPTAAPATKQPILTILKQARASGVGMVLATQNPVDLDYKALSNAGTWMIGRLQTERDKARLLDGLSSASGDTDVGELDRAISALGKREFLLHRTTGEPTTIFATRWAMSYLRGPVTGRQLGELPGREELATPAPSAPENTTRTRAEPDSPSTALIDSAAEAGSPVMPKVADGIPVRHLDPAAAWADEVGAVPGGTSLVAGIAVRVSLRFDDAKADLRHTETWEAILTPLDEVIEPTTAIVVDHDPRDFLTDAPRGATYVTPAARLGTKGYYTELQRRLRDTLVRDRTLEVLVNRELRLWGRAGESEEEFARRADEAAQQRADEEADVIRAKLASKIDRLRRAVDDAEQRADSAAAAVQDARSTELTGTIGSVLGGLLGGRHRTRGLASGARRVMSGRERVNRLERRHADAADAVAAKVDDLTELEAELAEQLVEIDDRWRTVADEVETVAIPLERSDVSVDELLLVWIPTSAA